MKGNVDIKDELDQVSTATHRKKFYSLTVGEITINKPKLEIILIKLRMNVVYILLHVKCVCMDYGCDAVKV